MRRMKTLTALGLPLVLLALLWQLAFAQATATVERDANLRAGPGTTYAITGGLKAGATVTIIGRNGAGDWYQLDSGQWIAAFLVADVTGPLPTTGATTAISATLATTPAATPATAYTRQEQQYAAALSPILQQYSTAMQTFSTQMLLAGKNPALILDEQWRLEMASALVAWNSLGGQVRAIQPPARLATMHKEIVSAAAHYEKAGDLVAAGLDQLDGDLLDQGNAEVILGIEALGRADAERQRLEALAPTATPAKTPVPTTATRSAGSPTPTRTPTAVPLASLRTALIAALGESNRDLDRLTGITVEETAITIQWTINDNFSEDWLKDEVRSDIVAILKTLWETKAPFTTINLAGTFSMRDRLGNVSEEIVVDVTYSSEIVTAINWGDRLFVATELPDNIYMLADYSYIHPEFK